MSATLVPSICVRLDVTCVPARTYVRPISPPMRSPATGPGSVVAVSLLFASTMRIVPSALYELSGSAAPSVVGWPTEVTTAPVMSTRPYSNDATPFWSVRISA